MPKYKTTAERVLQHILDRSDPAKEFISRTAARYGMLSLSASEFDEVLETFNIETHYHPDTKGQQYKVAEIAKALVNLRIVMQKVEETPFVFSPPEEDHKDEKV